MMHKSRLIRLMRSLNETEWSRLRLFLQSPYFTQNNALHWPEELFCLFHYIDGYSADLASETLTKESAYAHVFPGQTFVPGKLDRIMSKLSKVIEEFLIYEHSGLREDTVERQLVLAQYFRERKMAKAFKRTMEGMRKAQEKKTKRWPLLPSQLSNRT